jgi:hypothetical protein
MAHGKSVAASWTLRVASLPAGIALADIEELFLLLNCQYAA